MKPSIALFYLFFTFLTSGIFTDDVEHSYPDCTDGTFDMVNLKIVLPTLKKQFNWNIIRYHIWGVKQTRPHYMADILLTLKMADNPEPKEASCLFNVTVPIISGLCFNFNWLYCQLEGNLVIPKQLPNYCKQSLDGRSLVSKDPKCNQFTSTFIINTFILDALKARYKVGVERYTDMGLYNEIQAPCHYYFGNLWMQLVDGRKRSCDYHLYLFSDKTFQNFQLNCWE